MANDKPDTQHAAYAPLQAMREIVADVRGGTHALRSKTVAYLPKYPGELQNEYTARLNASTAFNMYSKTEAVITGMVFAGEIDTSGVATQIVPLLENIDNQGNDFTVFAREVFSKSMDGSCVILADSPTAAANDLGEQQALGIRPYLIAYDAASAINWAYRVNPVSKQVELSLLVLCEVTSEPKGRFEYETVTRYRVLWLENNQAKWELWRKVETTKKEAEWILDAAGVFAGFTELPVAIVGCLTDAPRLMDIADVNIKHYQKESSFDVIEYLSIPTFCTKGYESEEPVSLGASAHVKLPLEGDAFYCQIDAAGHDSLKGSLKDLQEQIRLLGSSVLADKTKQTQLTATEVSIDNVGETAEIRVWAEQLEDALERALGHLAMYLGLGKDKGGEIALSPSWANEATTTQDLTVLSGLVDAGQMSLESFVYHLEASGQLPPNVTAEQELERITAEEKEAAKIQPVLMAKAMPNQLNANQQTANATGTP